MTRDGRKAQIVIFLSDGANCALSGVVATFTPNVECQIKWDKEGIAEGGQSGNDLFMAPLGMLDALPIFAGDQVEEEVGGEWRLVFVRPCWRGFINCRWPQKVEA